MLCNHNKMKEETSKTNFKFTKNKVKPSIGYNKSSSILSIKAVTALECHVTQCRP